MTDEGRRCFSLSPKRETTRSGGPPRVASSLAEPEGGGGEAQLPSEAATTSRPLPGFHSFCVQPGALKLGAYSEAPSGSSEGGRGGKQWVRTGITRLSPYPVTKQKYHTRQ